MFPCSINTFSFKDQTIELVVPDANAVQEAYAKGEISFPYWSKVWSASIALSKFITEYSHYFQNKKVLELAAGLGLPSLVVAKFAVSVLSTDYEPAALEFIKASINRNHILNVTVDSIDWSRLPPDIETEVLLLSDVNYDPASFNELQTVLQQFLLKGTTVILSTPQRLMGKTFIEDLLHFCIQQEEVISQDDTCLVPVTLLVLKAE